MTLAKKNGSWRYLFLSFHRFGSFQLGYCWNFSHPVFLMISPLCCSREASSFSAVLGCRRLRWEHWWWRFSFRSKPFVLPTLGQRDKNNKQLVVLLLLVDLKTGLEVTSRPPAWSDSLWRSWRSTILQPRLTWCLLPEQSLYMVNLKIYDINHKWCLPVEALFV